MATWIAHMRIAEHFMETYGSLNNTAFLVGNIAPDSGVPNKDWSVFTPNPSTTHWKTTGDIDAEGFEHEYLQTKCEKYPFYLGYYFHLLTDIEWSKLFSKKTKEQLYAEGLKADNNFIWTIKKDWYGQDHVYLQQHKNSVFFTHFAKIETFPNIYLDYFPNEAFMHRIKYITDFYMDNHETENLSREFPFLSKEEMDEFVSNTISVLESKYN